MQTVDQGTGSKVASVTLGFWVAKIAATTLGETGGDALSMTLKLGYAESSLIFLGFFALAVGLQIAARRFHPVLYWAVIVATTTAGTTMADFADRSLGIGYEGGSLLLAGLLVTTLIAWRLSLGSVRVDHVRGWKAEAFYWATILFSNTLGTALGDFLSDRVGFRRSALVFAGALVVVAALHFFTRVSTTLLFWAAFVLTRPLGASIGDLLTKSHDEGGLALGRFSSSAVLGAVMIACVAFSMRRDRLGDVSS